MNSIYDEIKRIARLRGVSITRMVEQEIGLSWETVRKWNRFEPSLFHRNKAMNWLSKQKENIEPKLGLDMMVVKTKKQSIDPLTAVKSKKQQLIGRAECSYDS